MHSMSPAASSAGAASAAMGRDMWNLLMGADVDPPRLGSAPSAHKAPPSGAAATGTGARIGEAERVLRARRVLPAIGIPWENAIACPHDHDPAWRDDALRRGRSRRVADPHPPTL